MISSCGRWAGAFDSRGTNVAIWSAGSRRTGTLWDIGKACFLESGQIQSVELDRSLYTSLCTADAHRTRANESRVVNINESNIVLDYRVQQDRSLLVVTLIIPACLRAAIHERKPISFPIGLFRLLVLV